MAQDPWRLRLARVDRLKTAHPHAAELLTFYGRTIALQESTARGVRPSEWLSGEDVGTKPSVSPARFSVSRHIDAFQSFAGDIADASTDTLATVAVRLAESTPTAAEVLEAFVSDEPIDDLAGSLDCLPVTLEFFPRGFIQPVVEVLVGGMESRATSAPPGADSAAAACSRCGWPPQLALLRDDLDVRGQRALVCALCVTEWRFPRATCPACGNTDSEQLRHHVSDEWPHVRIEECQRCHKYLKAIDLRRDGRAIPLVDELASVELDLWAEGEGLEKIRRNLLGL